MMGINYSAVFGGVYAFRLLCAQLGCWWLVSYFGYSLLVVVMLQWPLLRAKSLFDDRKHFVIAPLTNRESRPRGAFFEAIISISSVHGRLHLLYSAPFCADEDCFKPTKSWFVCRSSFFLRNFLLLDLVLQRTLFRVPAKSLRRKMLHYFS